MTRLDSLEKLELILIREYNALDQCDPETPRLGNELLDSIGFVQYAMCYRDQQILAEPVRATEKGNQ